MKLVHSGATFISVYCRLQSATGQQSPPPPTPQGTHLRIGLLSILVMSMSRSANTLSALNSCPGPSLRLNTMLVLKGLASASPSRDNRGSL